MKRFGMLIILSLVILLSIGSFYIYSTSFASRLPQYDIKMEAGNKKEITPLTISGVIVDGPSEGLTITSSGTKYDNQRSFMERYSTTFGYDDSLDSYQTKYRGFMRGKLNPSSFNEDSKSIAYAGVNYKIKNDGLSNLTFAISILNKANKKVTSFKEIVPKGSRYNEVYVADVQKKGEQLDVMTVNSVPGSPSAGSSTEIHHYKFDMKMKKVYQDDTIMSAPTMQNNIGINFNQVRQASDTASNNYFVFCKTIQHTDPNNSGAQISPDKNEFYAYDYLSEKIKKISYTAAAVNQNAPQFNLDNWYNGTNIYFVKVKQPGADVQTYNLNKNKLTHEWTVRLPDFKPQSELWGAANNNRLYIAVMNHASGNNKIQNQPSAYVLVANFEGKTLYQGKVVKRGNSSSQFSKGALQVNSINVKK